MPIDCGIPGSGLSYGELESKARNSDAITRRTYDPKDDKWCHYCNTDGEIATGHGMIPCPRCDGTKLKIRVQIPSS